MVSQSKRKKLAAERARAMQQVVVVQKKAGPSSKKRKKKGANSKSMAGSFAACVLNPFASVGNAMGVPDRYDGLSVMIENTTVASLHGRKAAPGDIVLGILPVPGLNLFNLGLFGDGPLAGTPQVYTANIPPGEFLKFSQFRTISLAVKVTYIGKALDASGVIYATQYPTKAVLFTAKLKAPSVGAGVVRPTPNTATEQVMEIMADLEKTYSPAKRSDTAKACYDEMRTKLQERLQRAQRVEVPAAGNTIRICALDAPVVSPTVLLAQPDSIMVQAARGITCVAKHRTGDAWNFSPIFETQTYLTYEPYAAQGKPDYEIATKDLFANGEAVYGLDDGSNGLLLRFSGLSSDDFMVEVRHCIEAVPGVELGIYRSLARPSPPGDRAALDRVTDAQRKLPTGTSGDAVSWGALVRKAISGVDVGKIVSGLGHLAIGPAMNIVDSLLN